VKDLSAHHPRKPAILESTKLFAAISSANSYNIQDKPAHELLRKFDLDSRYGPCMGLTRLERWERAQILGLNPPVEIRQILDNLTDASQEISIWDAELNKHMN